MSVSAGTFTVGTSGTYPTWAAAAADVAANLTGDLEFTQTSDTVETSTPTFVTDCHGFDLILTSSVLTSGKSTAGNKSVFGVNGFLIGAFDGLVTINNLNLSASAEIDHLISILPSASLSVLMFSVMLNGSGFVQNNLLADLTSGLSFSFLNIYNTISWNAVGSGFSIAVTAAGHLIIENCSATACTGVGFLFGAGCNGTASNLLAIGNSTDFVTLNSAGLLYNNCACGDYSITFGTNCFVAILPTDILSLVPVNDSFFRVVPGSNTAISGVVGSIGGNTVGVRGNTRSGTYSIGADQANTYADTFTTPLITMGSVYSVLFEQATATSDRFSLQVVPTTITVSTVFKNSFHAPPVSMYGLLTANWISHGVLNNDLPVIFEVGANFIVHGSNLSSIIVDFSVTTNSIGFGTPQIVFTPVLTATFRGTYIDTLDIVVVLTADATFFTNRAPEGTVEAEYELTGKRRCFPLIVYVRDALSENDLGTVPSNGNFLVALSYSGIEGDIFFNQGAAPGYIGTNVVRNDGAMYIAFRQPLPNEVVWDFVTQSLYRFQNVSLNDIVYAWTLYRPMPQRGLEGQLIFDAFDVNGIYPYYGRVLGALQYKFAYDTLVLLDQLDADKAATFYLPALAANFGLDLNFDDTETVRRSKTRNAVPAFRLKGTPEGVAVWLRALGYKGYANEIWIDPGYPTLKLIQTLAGDAGNVAIDTTAARLHVVGFVGGDNLTPAHGIIAFREHILPVEGDTISISRIAEFSATNYLENSNRADLWSLSNVTIGASLSGPDTVTSVPIILEGGSGSTTHSLSPVLDTITVSLSQITTFSVFVKRDSGSACVRLRVKSTDVNHYYECVFDLNSFAIVPGHGTNGGTFLNARVVPYTNGWYRLIVTGIHSDTVPFSSVFVNFLTSGYLDTYAAGSSGIAFFGGQFELSPDATSPIVTGAGAVTRAATNERQNITFEFDTDSHVGAGNIAVTLVRDDTVSTVANLLASMNTHLAGICSVIDITSPNIVGPPINDQSVSTKPFGCLDPNVNPSNFLEVPHGYFSAEPEVYFPSSRICVHLNRLDGLPLDITPAIKAAVASELHLSVLPVHVNIKQFATDVSVGDDSIVLSDTLTIIEREIVYVMTIDGVYHVCTPDGRYELIGDHEVFVGRLTFGGRALMFDGQEIVIDLGP